MWDTMESEREREPDKVMERLVRWTDGDVHDVLCICVKQ